MQNGLNLWGAFDPVNLLLRSTCPVNQEMSTVEIRRVMNGYRPVILIGQRSIKGYDQFVPSCATSLGRTSFWMHSLQMLTESLFKRFGEIEDHRLFIQSIS